MSPPAVIANQNTPLPESGAARTPWALLFAVNALTCLVRGYRFNVEDQHLTLPVLKRALDPSLFPGDLLFTKPLSDFSLYENLLATPAKLLGIELSFFILYVLVTFAITVAVYKIACELFRSPTLGIVAAAMLCGAHTAAGAMRLQLFDDYLYPRTVSLAFGLFAYLFMVRGSWPRAAFCVGLEFAVHPPSALVTLTVLAACMASAIAKGRLGPKEFVLSACMFLVPASILLAKMLIVRGGRGLEFFGSMDPRWYRIIHSRTYYMFYRNWPLSRFGQIAFYVGMFLVAARHTVPAGRRVMLTALFCAVGLNVLNFVVRDVLKLPVFMQLHLEVSIKLAVFLGLVHIGPYVWMRIRRADPLTRAVGVALLAQVALMRGGESWLGEDAWRTTSTLAWVIAAALLGAMELPRVALCPPRVAKSCQFVALCLWPAVAWDAALALTIGAAAAMLVSRRRGLEEHRVAVRGALVLLAAFGLLEFARSAVLRRGIKPGIVRHFTIPYIRLHDTFTELTDWMRRHTPRSAMFAGHEALQTRYASERSYFVTYKDGGQVLYDRDYAIEWDQRIAMARLLNRSSDAAIERLAPRLGIDYIIAGSAQRPSLPIAFENEDFVVCDLCTPRKK